MIERPESGQATPDRAQNTTTPAKGHFLKSIDETTDADTSEVEDESDGMAKPDFLGTSNLENRGEASEEDKK
ncbi:hypothetical protein [Fibrella forsythiae]|uniref:Uncharacterized protein n=1 Tax=Fibrella forsythiae TaxID=2817061 RepID=A0ABS3JS22_9BACT|nr:hypothetical protein [Fibrella forsythiae]MBO0952818.1 hypothetical protein [Fibrella forsythiae]